MLVEPRGMRMTNVRTTRLHRGHHVSIDVPMSHFMQPRYTMMSNAKKHQLEEEEREIFQDDDIETDQDIDGDGESGVLQPTRAQVCTQCHKLKHGNSHSLITAKSTQLCICT